VWEELNFTGRNVNVAILDGGVDDVGHESLDDMDDDPMTPLDPKFMAGYVFPAGGKAVNPHGDPAIGHGTHVAGTAIGTGGSTDNDGDGEPDFTGVAPGSRLIDVKVISDAGMGGIILPALEWCAANVDTDWDNDGSPAEGGNPDGIQIISMSLGGASSAGDDAISEAVNDCVDAGIVAVAAMGNNGAHGVDAPAAADKCIAVAALDDKNTVNRNDDTKAGYSNYGPRADDGDADPYDELKPDVIAPGSGIMAPRAYGEAVYVAMNGTSMATPHVSGVVALMLEANPDLTPARVKEILHRSAEMKGSHHNYPTLDPKYDTEYGWGMLDGYKAVRLGYGNPDLTVDTLYLSDNTPNAGDRVDVNYRIKNIGKISSDRFRVELWDDTEGERIAFRNHNDELREGNSAQGSFGWTPETDGEHVLRILILNSDPEESDITNNEKERTVDVNKRPIASITANRTTVYTYESIEFDGSGSTDDDGTVRDYKFDLGDGTVTSWARSAEKEHEYTDDGVYTARLQVRDEDGAESEEWDDVTITVKNRKPSADAGDDFEGGTAEDVPFNGTGEDMDGTIAKYEWDFEGDGSWDWSSTENGDTTHRYSTEGNYNAALRITDDDGETDVDYREVRIDEGTGNHLPHAIIKSPEDEEAFHCGEYITFDGSDSYDDEDDPDDLTYTWESSIDGILGDQRKFSIDTLSSGEHTITLTVEDTGGKTDQDSVNILLNSPAVFDIIRSPSDGALYRTGDAVLFDMDVSDPDGGGINYNIKSDLQGSLNGGTAENDHIEYSITDLFVGYHTITITLWDENDAETVTTLTLTVNTPPMAVIDSPADGSSYRENDFVEFNATSSHDDDHIDQGNLDYTWTLDGDFLSGKKLFRQKLTQGNHTVGLTVSDGKHDDYREVEITITEFESELEAVISTPLEDDIYSTMENITFDGRKSTDRDGKTAAQGAELLYRWYADGEYFGNKSYLSSRLAPGRRAIRLEVEDVNGEKNSSEVNINVNEPPRAIMSSPSEGDKFFTDEEVLLDGTGSYDREDGSDLAFEWYEDGTKVSTDPSYSTTFSHGSHRIRLVVIDSMGESNDTETRIVVRKHYFTLDISEEEGSVDAGDSIAFSVTIENKAELDDEFELEATSPGGWTVEYSGGAVSSGKVPVKGNSAETFIMTVGTPADAGDSQITLAATSGKVTKDDFVTVIIISYEFSLKISPKSITITGEEQATFTVTVKNEGTGEDTITLRPDNVPAKWTVKLSSSKITVAPGKSKTVTLTATTTDREGGGISFFLKGVSQHRPLNEKVVDVHVILDAPQGDDDDDDDSPGFESGLAILSVGAALAFSMSGRKIPRRRRKG